MHSLIRTFLVSLLLLATASASAQESGDTGRMPVSGDCAAYREGGEGYLLTTPTWWLRGTIIEVYTRRRRMDLCPALGKMQAQYSRDDWGRMTEAYPCVSSAEKVREVEAIRIRLRVDAWETPWTNAHGHNGRLYRGQYLKTELKQGVELDIDGSLLQRCEPRP